MSLAVPLFTLPHLTLTFPELQEASLLLSNRGGDALDWADFRGQGDGAGPQIFFTK